MQSDTGISEELSEKILGYVEREAGRDWPLSPEDEAMVRDLLERDPAAKALADGFRRSNANLDAMFDTTAVTVPDGLVAMVRAHGAREKERARGTDEVDAAPATAEVVAFPPESKRRSWFYGPLAAAASLALVVTGGALVYSIRAQNELERTVAALQEERQTQQAEIQTLQAETGSLEERLTAALDARQDAEMAFSAASGDVARLEAELSAVAAARDEAERSLASIAADLEGAQGLNADLEERLTASEEEGRQTAAQSAVERDRLRQEAAELEDQLAAATNAQQSAEAGLAAANSTVAELIKEGSTLNQEVAALEAELAARGERLTTAETALAVAERQIAAFATERETLASRLAEGEQRLTDLAGQRDSLAAEAEQAEQALAATQDELASVRNQSVAFQTALETFRRQTGWLAQVAGYHIGYAGKPREVEVKVQGDDRAAIQEAAEALSGWLSSELGRDIKIPFGLPMAGGLDFVGGRVLPTLSGVPVGQIAYHDDQGRLTAFCLKRNPTGDVQGLERRQFFDRLQMVHWQDEEFQYVVVGFADYEALEPVAEWLKNNYWSDI